MAGQRKLLAALGIGTVAVVGGAVLFVWSGAFNIAADEPHSRPVFKLAELVRERSIATRAGGVTVPPLDDPTTLMAGGADYNEMCTGCHLKPGMAESELRDAMYPQPPDLTKAKRDPAQTFWIIKHGIKMSGMPAWGATHDDARIWAMVAFLQQLPRLTPEQYQILTARSDDEPEEHEHAGGMGGMDLPQEGRSGESTHEKE
jgi:mono/diheme cytochrome c family protein